MPNTITYKTGDPGLVYVNVTNRCTNRCTFCIRDYADGVGSGTSLWLDREPAIDEIIAALQNECPCEEIVFCGYGEPLMRFDDVMKVCAWVKRNYPGTVIRINTNGHASIFAGRDVAPEMAGLVDAISISLNAPTAPEYEKICKSDYGEEGFSAMLSFALSAKNHVPRVILSVLDCMEKEKIEACRKLAAKLSCDFRIRSFAT